MAEYGWKPHRIRVAQQKTYHGLQFAGTSETQGVWFHRIRDFKHYYFNSIPPTSHLHINIVITIIVIIHISICISNVSSIVSNDNNSNIIAIFFYTTTTTTTTTNNNNNTSNTNNTTNNTKS